MEGEAVVNAARLARAGWVAVVAFVVAAVAFGVLARAALPGTELVVSTLGCVLALAWGGVGAGLARVRPRHPLGWVMLAFGAVFAVKVALGHYAVAGLLAGRHLAGAGAAAWVQSWVDLLAYPAGLVVVLLLFPTGRLAGRYPRVVLGLAWVAGAAILAERILEPGPLVAGFSLRLPVDNPITVRPGVLALGWPLALLAILLAAGDVVRRARKAPVDERRPVRLLAAVGVLMALTITGFVPAGMLSGGLHGPLSTAVALVFAGEVAVLVPFVLAAGVTRNRLHGVDRVLDKALAYAGLTVVVVVLYVGVIGYLGALVGRGVTEPARLLGTALVAVAFQPVRDRVQRLADRLVYGPAGDPRTVVRRLADRHAAAGSALDLADFARAAQEAVGVRYAAIRVENDGTASRAVHRIPLTWQGEVVGMAEFDAASVAVLPAGRRHLLDDLLRLAGQVVYEQRQRGRLEESHERLTEAHRQLLDAQAVERRRLRHDLHDGVQPALAALRLTLAAAQRLHGRDAEREATVLDEAAHGLEQVTTEVRAVLTRMRPTSLEEYGLRGAILDTAHQLGLAAELEPGPALPPLPAEVEVAALRIAHEALHNVLTHARASWCGIAVCVEQDALVVRVDDDGIGWGGAGRSHHGLGLDSMRRRAADLGGEAHIGERNGGGTTVRARIPLGTHDG